MPDEKKKSPEKEATEALQGLLQRIGDVFGLFDLSFFVAGAVCLGALVFGGWLALGDGFKAMWPQEMKVLHVGVGAVGAYVLGIVCFAFGRMLSRRKDFYAHLQKRIEAFGVKDEVRPWLDSTGPSEMYTVLWVELRQNKELSPSFNLLLRYWVMAAMCDGLFIAFGIWTLAWLCWIGKPLGAYVSFLGWPQPDVPRGFVRVAVLALLAGATLICRREGRRYADGQMTELLATLAHRRGAGDKI